MSREAWRPRLLALLDGPVRGLALLAALVLLLRAALS